MYQFLSVVVHGLFSVSSWGIKIIAFIYIWRRAFMPLSVPYHTHTHTHTYVHMLPLSQRMSK